MPASLRRDLEAVLAQFAASHRGVRLGQLFGQPAVYAGRRAFARVSARGLEVKLPASARDGAVRLGVASRSMGNRRRDVWTLLRVDTASAVGSWLEMAARHAAEALVASTAAEGR